MHATALRRIAGFARQRARQLTAAPGGLRVASALLLAGLLSACAGHPNIPATQEAAQYVAHAQRSYAAPGPAGDPWGPYIEAASQRFDVPQAWIRGVMRVESGDHEFRDGAPIVSPVGAMGLMQLMPVTYDLMRSQYDLGDDPFDPRNNILAGAAYIRQMYDIYGTPGFLAAYNAGPGRLDDYLTHNRPLPDETRRYVAMIGPGIAGSYPVNRSDADLYAMNQIPTHIPPGPRFPPARRTLYAEQRGRRPLGRDRRRDEHGATLRYADAREAPREPAREAHGRETLPIPPREAAPALRLARYRGGRSGFRLIAPAMADTLPLGRGGPGDWAIQVGAYGSVADARSALGSARSRAGGLLGRSRPDVASVHERHGLLYRARLVGLSHEAAVGACQHLPRGGCIVLSPNAQF